MEHTSASVGAHLLQTHGHEEDEGYPLCVSPTSQLPSVPSVPRIDSRARGGSQARHRLAKGFQLLCVAGLLVLVAKVVVFTKFGTGSFLVRHEVTRELALGKATDKEGSAGSVSLFCWAHMQPELTQEVALIKMQFRMHVSIWLCDGVAVISTDKIKLGMMDGEPVYTWKNEAPAVRMGSNGVDGATTDSFLNTEVFLMAWDSLINSGKVWAHDFVVKVDPDAVFLPDRLKKHVKDSAGHAVYFPNCGKYGPNMLLYGSLEVFSTEAIMLYRSHTEECKALPWEGWGEDYYMQKCMARIGVKAVPDSNQVGDDRCNPAKCDDWTKTTFHDYKEPNDWYLCFQVAIGQVSNDEVVFGQEDLIDQISKDANGHVSEDLIG